MSLATAAAIGAVLLLIASQIRRRTQGESRVLNGVVRVLTFAVIALVAAYFFQRFAS